ncbi:MAG: hypothetical protein IKW60_03420 [Clostridia bacterium]|nr:hypothetical protein [Clostridia bacterium]
MERGRRFWKLLPWILSFVLLSGVLTVTYFLRERSGVLTEESNPYMKLAATYEPIVPVRTICRWKEESTFLFDGDTNTVACWETPWEVTLDLGKLHMLGGVRFFPVGENQTELDRCQGLMVSVSKDNRVFQKAAVAEPVDHIGYTQDWQELSFGGGGEFRYVKIQIPAGASIGEVECLGYPSWWFQPGRKQGHAELCLDLYAYDAQESGTVRILTGAFHENGVLKALQVTEQEISNHEGTTVPIRLSVPRQGIGDRYRVMAWDNRGVSLLKQDLNFRYTRGGMGFSVPNVFSDSMMFQAEKPVKIWGTAPIGSQVRLILESETGIVAEKTVIANTNSDWVGELGQFPYGGSYSLTISCGGESKVFHDLTFGDVWVLIGQSNMDYHLLGGEDTKTYLRSAQGKKETNNENIRLLNLWMKGTGGSGQAVANLPIGYRNPAWSKMNTEAASYCSAIGYFFANQIYREHGLPVGLMNLAVGDTEINRWIPNGATYGAFCGTDGGLYYNRVMPLSGFSVRGILMYQGEADEYRTHLSTEEYRDALCGLIDQYREIWGADLPFYWAQLTRYQKDESLIREGQRLALFGVKNKKNIGMISLMDVYGEFEGGAGNCREDIHPHQKQLVAERFVRLANRDLYGGDLPATGPVYLSARRVENGLELTFSATGNLRVMDKSQYVDALGREYIKESGRDENRLQEFEVAGEDGVFYPAEAEIQGSTVLVFSPWVDMPVMARYGWGAYPEMPNLTDDSLIPSSAFVTEMVTI